jgi:GT2 family glycosyltransferase
MNYFKEEELVSFVRDRLLSTEFEGLIIRIVDNGSTNRSVLESLSTDPRVKIHGDGKNLGYFGGAALATDEHVKEFGEVAQITVVSNFDIEWNDPELVSRLFEESIQSPWTVLAPRITDVQSSVEMNPYYKERIELTKLNRLLRVTSSYPMYLMYQWLHKLKRWASSGEGIIDDVPVYAVHGSFIVMKRDYFQKSAGLRFASFLYGEELFLAEECRKHGYLVGVLRSIHVYHNEHITTGAVKDKKHMKYLHESLNYIKKSYFSA